jgi:hypothetical protein
MNTLGSRLDSLGKAIFGKLNLFKRLKNITGADEKSPGVV